MSCSAVTTELPYHVLVGPTVPDRDPREGHPFYCTRVTVEYINVDTSNHVFQRPNSHKPPIFESQKFHLKNQSQTTRQERNGEKHEISVPLSWSHKKQTVQQ